MTARRQSKDPEPNADTLERKLEEYERWFQNLDGQVRHLERERQKFSAVVNHAGAGFLVIDQSLKITWANELIDEWFGDASESGTLVGLDCHQVLCRTSKTCPKCPAVEPFASGELCTREMDLPVRGQLRHIYATVMPITSPEGEVEESIVMLQDISEMEILRKSEDALRGSEERFRSIFENATAGVVANRSDGSFLQVNPAICRMLGYSEDELLRMTVTKITHAADREETLSFLREPERGERKTVETEQRYVHKDGHTVWALTSSSWLFDTEGRPLHAVSLIQDITERKWAENLLHERELRLRQHQKTLLELAKRNTIIEGDLQGALAEITEASSNTLGVERASVWLLEDDQSKLVCLDLYEASAESHSEGMELAAADCPAYFGALESDRTITARLADRDPRTRELARSYLLPLGITSMLDAPIRKGGLTVGVVCHEHVGPARRWTIEEQNFAGSIADLVSLALEQQERHRAEEARNLLATAIDQAAESVVVTDADGRIQYVNPAFGTISGYGPEEVLGDTPGFLDTGGNDAQAAGARWETLRAGRVWTGHLTRRRKDGSLCEEEATVSPVRDGSGRVVNFVAVSRDVTRQAELEERLRQAHKMEAIGSLAGGMAHDFNNLLTSILGYSNLLKDALEDRPDLREAAEVIESGARRGAELTQQLLGFARKGKNRDVSVDLHRGIRDTVALLSRTLDKRISIDQRLEAEAPFVQGDPIQLQQVMLNLAVNAGDAMPSGGELTFTTRQVSLEDDAPSGLPPGPYVMVSVSDTGRGIPNADIERIFEPFFTTKDPGEGTGMGLAMVYGIVENHAGAIQVESEVDRGTTIRVYLPVAAEKPRAERVPEETGDRATMRVLVVDDDAFIRSMATEMLEGLGYEVATAADGEQAVETYEESEFDLVLLDMVMPRMGGRDCFRALKEIDPDVRTVLSTGYGFNVAAQEILDEGVLGFLPKPYTLNELARAIGRVLGC
jgi:PAS domain S-box-containing protein